VEKEQREQNTFLQKLNEEWKLLWRERFDDKSGAEGVAARDYPLVLVERGCVVFAVRDAKTPSFSDVVNHWAAQGKVYAPDPASGGWGKFIRKHVKRVTPSTDTSFKEKQTSRQRQQSKKGRERLASHTVAVELLGGMNRECGDEKSPQAILECTCTCEEMA